VEPLLLLQVLQLHQLQCQKLNAISWGWYMNGITIYKYDSTLYCNDEHEVNFHKKGPRSSCIFYENFVSTLKYDIELNAGLFKPPTCKF